MKNRWMLTEEVKEKYTPIVQEFINKLESVDEDLEINLSDTELNPYTLKKLLEDIGYEDVDMDHNGWQFDFWITMKKSGFKNLCIKGTGITFELKLTRKQC